MQVLSWKNVDLHRYIYKYITIAKKLKTFFSEMAATRKNIGSGDQSRLFF